MSAATCCTEQAGARRGCSGRRGGTAADGARPATAAPSDAAAGGRLRSGRPCCALPASVSGCRSSQPHLHHRAALLALLLAFLGLAPVGRRRPWQQMGGLRRQQWHRQRRTRLRHAISLATAQQPQQRCCCCPADPVTLGRAPSHSAAAAHRSPLTMAIRVSVCSPLSCFFLGGMAAAAGRGRAQHQSSAAALQAAPPPTTAGRRRRRRRRRQGGSTCGRQGGSIKQATWAVQLSSCGPPGAAQLQRAAAGKPCWADSGALRAPVGPQVVWPASPDRQRVQGRRWTPPGLAQSQDRQCAALRAPAIECATPRWLQEGVGGARGPFRRPAACCLLAPAVVAAQGRLSGPGAVVATLHFDHITVGVSTASQTCSGLAIGRSGF